MLPTDLKSQNKYVKGNIQINHKLLNKYKSVSEIFEKQKIENTYFKINSNTNNFNVTLKIEEYKNLAYTIFNTNHSNNEFINDDNKIIVSKTGINESIEKIYNNHTQRDLINEHLLIFCFLGKIIEKAKLVNQAYERKGREKYISWHYYLDGVKINNKNYLVEFEVVSMNNGKNLYRVQRLHQIKNKQPRRGF